MWKFPSILAAMVPLIGLSAQVSTASDYTGQNLSSYGSLCEKGSWAFDEAFRVELVGNWKTKHSTGYVSTKQTGIMAFPPSGAEAVTIWAQDGQLFVSNNNDMRQLELEPYDEKGWRIKRYPWEDLPTRDGKMDASTLVSQAIAAGCESVSEMPRFVGTIKVRQQGIDMTMDAYITVMSGNRMFGILRANGDVKGREIDPGAPLGSYDFWMWRAFTMTRE